MKVLVSSSIPAYKRRRRRMLNHAVAILLSATVLLVVDLAAPGTASAADSSNIGWQYSYDDQGRMTSITDPAQRKTQLRYTEDNRGNLTAITRVLPSGAVVALKFDQFERRTEMVDELGTVRYTYDNFDRLIAVNRDGSPSLRYTYDTQDRVVSVRISSQFTVEYEYDFRGRMRKVTTPVGNILYSYNSATDEVVRRLPNGITTRWQQKPAGGLDFIAHTSAGARVLAQYQYTHRLDGLITSIKELTSSGVQTVNYGYDTVQRLVSASGANLPTIEFSYDMLGNLTQRSQQDPGATRGATEGAIDSQYDWAGRLSRHDAEACQHDPAGNLTSCKGSSQSFAFDDSSLLETASVGNDIVRYHYDGDGYLLSRRQGATTQAFTNDPFSDVWQPLVVKDSVGRETFYVWVGTSPLMAMSGDSVRFFLHDHLGSVRLVTDEGGNVVERFNYTPFGQLANGSAGKDLQPGFAGLFFDGAASLYLTRARAYDPKLGRFLQRDPEHRLPGGSQKDLSMYAYSGGDPVNFVDLNGAAPTWATYTYWSTGAKQLLDPTASMELIDPTGSIRSSFDYWSTGAKQLFDPTGSIFDPTSAKKWYAAAAERSLSQAGQIGVPSAFARATFFELVSGYIPGKQYSRGAGHASMAWSLAGGLGTAIKIGYRELVLPSPFQKQVFGSISRIRSIATPFIKASEGGTRGVVIDKLKSMAYSKATKFLSAESFDYLTRDLTSNFARANLFLGHGLKTVSNAMESWKHVSSYAKRAVKTWEVEVSPEYSHSAGVSSNNYSGFNQSKVGGIRLTGAGDALSHLGNLEGIALDEINNRMVLIGEGQRPINLPPLRLDDVVTVFRSVYMHGEAPNVSIDPVSDSDDEEFMDVVHGAATNNTYVGWVLYEADRLMKSYAFFQDNKTKRQVYSNAPGYRDFFKYTRVSRAGNWERFWIVPASVTGNQGSTDQLTIFDVPLKLETEKMQWQGGRLVTATDPTPSQTALAYQEWFSNPTVYNAISEETRLRPPVHCGFAEPVPVFQELRRIALITAIAETLRDQNVPFPAWMHDYPVKPCISDRQTPIIRTSKEHLTLTGGVQLAVSDENRSTNTDDAGITQLAQLASSRVSDIPLFSSVSFNDNNKSYNAVTLPGSDTLQSGANILQYTDLIAPELLEAGVGLTRHFNSFYDPQGIFGRGWTLDMPRLESYRQPVSRTETSIAYKTVYELSSPLNTWSERFAELEFVPGVNGQLLVPSTSTEMLGLTESTLATTGQQTTRLLFRDGSSWHFNEEGYLVASSNGDVLVVYDRDDSHKLISVQSWDITSGRLQASPTAEVRLDYDTEQKRVRSVEASVVGLDETNKVYYLYDSVGQLMRAFGSGWNIEYSYNDGLVASITEDGELQASFAYNDQGQLTRETRGDGETVAFSRIQTSNGTKIAAIDTTSQNVIETIEYDSNFTPLRQTSADGSITSWQQGEESRETTVTQPNGEYYTVNDSNDGRHSTLESSTGIISRAEFDVNGRLISSSTENGASLQQTWRADDQLQAAISDSDATLFRYSRNGTLSSVMVTAPDQAQQRRPDEFVNVAYDARGRANNITDGSGGAIEINYDGNDQPTTINSARGSVIIDRDGAGQVIEIDTSWGTSEQYDYDSNTGDLSRIAIRQQSAGTVQEQIIVDLVDGRVSKISQADGGETILDYITQGSQQGLLRTVRTPEQLALAYSYDNSDQITGIEIGAGTPVSHRIEYDYDLKGQLTGISYVPTP